MSANGWFQILLFLCVIFLITRPLGAFISRVFNHEKTFLDPVMRPLEKLIYRLIGVDETREMRWTEYAIAMLLYSVVSLLVLYVIERTQQWLFLNPQKLAAVPADVALNTAVSFTTNTNWQSYTPETTMSYLTQMAGLSYHNFTSAAVGIAMAVALIRGIARRESKTIGNFWVDMTRALLWILLPLTIVGSLVLVSQGVIQNFKPYVTAHLTDSQKVMVTSADGKTVTQTITQQTIPQGPVASQEVIKELGTNGGGFFNANSAHPYENPTPFSDFFEMLLIFAIPSALTYTLGRMTGSQRHGWALWSAMAIIFLAAVTVAYWAEARGNPQFAGVDQTHSAAQSGGNMEGKEVRFGIVNSALWATVTTDTSCGAVNSMHDSFTPLGGLVPLTNLMLGEIIFGGVGSGLYGMVVFVIIALFVAGLMVGRTQEYLGKKLEAKEVKMTMLAILCLPLSILVFTGIGVVVEPGLAGISNAGPHGFSEVLYAYTEGTNNNGSAFAGLSSNTPFYNTTIGLAMLVGRFFVIIPMLAIAGALAAKNISPPSAGTFPTDSGLFAGLLVGVIVIVGGLTYFPAVALGPLAEQFAMNAGTLF